MNFSGELADNVWIFRRPFRLVSVGLGLTMTAIRLGDGELLIVSPVRLTGELRARLDEIGKVRYVIAPSALHHLFIRDYGPAFPGARLYALPALKAKRADIYFHGELTDKPETFWSDVLDQIEIKGVREGADELAFFHKPTRTAILTDLIFNLSSPHSAWEKVFYAINGLGHGPVCSRVYRYGVVRDREALRESVDKILAWKPERLIVGHGEPLTHGAEAAIRSAFAWLK